MRRYLFPLILGIGGIAILISLGLWQVRRMEWKAGVLASINGRLAADPIDLATIPGPNFEDHNYQAVRLEGATTGQELLVLAGRKGLGAGYRVIAAFETAQGARIMVDRGFVSEADRRNPRPATPLIIAGNLMWPEDADRYTPPPDLKSGLWFARDVTTMAQALDTEPLLVVAREVAGDDQGVEVQPVDTSGIPNDHFGYAITWFSLALVWAGMTGFLLWRIRAKTI